jgi:serine/threonine protein kinase
MVSGLGTTLQRLGDFRLLREVGRGGMGCVYEAEQESLGRRVAIKVLAGHRLLDPKLLARFHREAKAAARLHHTNIVPVFGVGEQDGVHFYVMQFIQGLGLDAVLDEVRRLQRSRAEVASAHASASNHAPTAASVAHSFVSGRFAPPDTSVTDLSEAQSPAASAARPASRSALTSAGDSARRYALGVARIGLQVAEALEYDHEQGILHRDVKPSNLLLDAHGNVWVADFGLAKVGTDSDLTQTGDIIGTVRYMAPERFGGKCDAGSDVYALGLTLYELLARRPAFEVEDRNALIRAVTQSAPPRLRTLERAVSRDLETIVHKAIEREPAHRYASAASLADDLRRFLEDRPIAARRIGPGERLARWARRNPGVAGLTAAVFALMFALTAGSMLATLRIRRSEQSALREAVRAEAEARRATAARDAEAAARRDVEAGNAALRTREDDLRRAVYAARINLVQAAFDAGDVALGAARLDQTRPKSGEPDLRGFEWNYWRRQTHNERTSVRLVSAEALASAGSSDWILSGDGSRAAGVVPISREGRALVVLDTATLRSVFRAPVAWRDATRVHLALNRDGTRLASYQESARESGSSPPVRGWVLRVWDIVSGQVLPVDHGEIPATPYHGITALAMSPDGKQVARVLREHEDLGSGIPIPAGACST